MEPIFNEKVAEKLGLWVSWTVHKTHWCALSTTYFAGVNSALIEKLKITAQKKKKEKKKKHSRKMCCFSSVSKPSYKVFWKFYNDSWLLSYYFKVE